MIAAPWAFLAVALHIVAGMAVGYGLLRICRWIRGQSPLLGAIVMAGILLQATSGLLMFWVSYLNLPVLSGLHSGDGFWEIAPDAEFYTTRAALAIDEGLTTIDSTEASPMFLRLLTIWLHLVGISPASGMFLNMTLYGLLCALVIRVWKPSANWRRDLPLAVLLASVSFSPLLVFSGTQTLKDNTYLFLLAGACVGAWLVLGPVIQGLRKGAPFSDVLAGLGLLLLSLYAMAGIRAYYAFMMWATLSLMLAIVAGPWSVERLVRRLPLAVAIVTLTFVSFLVGAGPYVETLSDAVLGRSDKSEASNGWITGAFKLIDRYRLGFETTPAATNIAARRPRGPRDEELPPAPDSTTAAAPRPLAAEPSIAPDDESPTPDPPAVSVVTAATQRSPEIEPPAAPGDTSPAPDPPAVPVLPSAPPAPVDAVIATPPPSADVSFAASLTGVFVYAPRLTVGLATFFVPMSLLRALSLVQFPGGRGLLFLTDVDTLFLDATMIASLVLLSLRWSTARRHLPYVCSLLLLGFVSIALLSYVVINFGTMVRLRPMAVVPIWMAVLAAAPRRDRTEIPLERATVRDVIE